MPGAEESAGPSGSPAGPPPGGASTQFAAKTLSSLLSTQTQGSGASAGAATLISALDTNGDGTLSLDEVQAGLKDSSATDVAGSFAKLDGNGDGSLSTSELSTALQSAHKGHHGRHGRPAEADAASTQAPPTAADLSAKLISSLDANGDGTLSLDEIQSSLKTDGSGSSDATTSLTAAIAKLDTNGDGQLGASELTSALQAFQDAHNRTQASAATETSVAV